MKEWLKSLFPHDKPVRYVLTVFVVLFLVALGTRYAKADPVFEVGAQTLRGHAAAVGFHLDFPVPEQDGRIETGFVLVGESTYRPGVIVTEALYVDGFKRLELGLGLGFVNHTSDLNGSNLNFSLLVRVRLTDRWWINVRHWSNAGTKRPNTGLDIATIGYRF